MRCCPGQVAGGDPGGLEASGFTMGESSVERLVLQLGNPARAARDLGSNARKSTLRLLRDLDIPAAKDKVQNALRAANRPDPEQSSPGSSSSRRRWGERVWTLDSLAVPPGAARAGTALTEGRAGRGIGTRIGTGIGTRKTGAAPAGAAVGAGTAGVQSLCDRDDGSAPPPP